MPSLIWRSFQGPHSKETSKRNKGFDHFAPCSNPNHYMSGWQTKTHSIIYEWKSQQLSFPDGFQTPVMPKLAAHCTRTWVLYRFSLLPCDSLQMNLLFLGCPEVFLKYLFCVFIYFYSLEWSTWLLIIGTTLMNIWVKASIL